ncbi:FMN-binding protein [Candidatus Dependentiae bacterium]|nr:FMN-binding protein [Candidatus Dependentiae bacterium]
MKEYLKYTGVLLIIAIIAAVALGGIYKATKPNIDKQEELEKANALKIIFGDFDMESIEVLKIDDETEIKKIYSKDGDFIGVAFEVIGKGFSSSIKTTVGMKTDGTIIGIKVTYQEETPGLGARMNEVKSSKYLWTFWKSEPSSGPSYPTFQHDFYNKKYTDLRLSKSGDINDETPDIEAITGATISSKAVLDSVVIGCEKIHDYLKKNPDIGDK